MGRSRIKVELFVSIYSVQVLRLLSQNFQLWPGLMSGILFSGTGLHKARLTFCPLQQQWNPSKYFVLWIVPLAVDRSLSVFVSLLSPDCFLAISIINSIDSFGRIKKIHLMQNSAFFLLINQYWVPAYGLYVVLWSFVLLTRQGQEQTSPNHPCTVHKGAWAPSTSVRHQPSAKIPINTELNVFRFCWMMTENAVMTYVEARERGCAKMFRQ